jgi:hypothetical protein
MKTDLPGRLRNTRLPLSRGLLPLFEAVVNSIHSIEEGGSVSVASGEISVEIIRVPQTALDFSDQASQALESIVGFKIVDNGVGFNDRNMESFETFDSGYKAKQGCRGIGRLLWLKAFEKVTIASVYDDYSGQPKLRKFSFTAYKGIADSQISEPDGDAIKQTTVHLDGFNKAYREKAPKTAKAISNNLFEHCLWYFIREGGAPKIKVRDGLDVIHLDEVYSEYMYSSSDKEVIDIKGHDFELTHLKLKVGAAKSHLIAWCAGNRVVEEENIAGKIVGLHGKLRDKSGDFIYACYVTSNFLDENVRPERIGFDMEKEGGNLFSETELYFPELRSTVLAQSEKHLYTYLQESKQAGMDRVERFVSRRAPRYRPILSRIAADQLTVDPEISDKELDLLLHKHLSEIEGRLLADGHDIMNFSDDENIASYQARLREYLKAADDIKKSDLVNYVFHRKVVLDILEKLIQRDGKGKYAREALIHELIMPMRKTSNEVTIDRCNLWLIDERLAFHNFLASDKPLSSMPIIDSKETKEPDILVLNIFDEPILVSEGTKLPLASIVVIEIKRPMRNDASVGEEKDPVEQTLGYLERVRTGDARTTSGRPIPRSEDIPGFCYVICDITSSIERRCKVLGLKVMSDHLGYFGYNDNYKAYIEVISYDRLVNAAKERNRAFFDQLGLPTT